MSARKYINYEYKYGFTNCPTCGKEFRKHAASSKFCSVECRKKHIKDTSIKEQNRKMWYEPDAFIKNRNGVLMCRCYPCAENCNNCKLSDCTSTARITQEEAEFIEWIVEACGMVTKHIDQTR